MKVTLICLCIALLAQQFVTFSCLGRIWRIEKMLRDNDVEF